MRKDDRSPLNPFTGKEHYDNVDDDEFLNECYNVYYEEVNQYQLIDDTEVGQQVIKITFNLIKTVEDYLIKIGRYDYVDGYYDWEVHVVNSDIANACCYPGGKILVYAGILSVMENESELAFVLGHEISHALLDHSRTQQSIEQKKNAVSNVSWMGSFALDMLGFGEVGDLARAAINVADVGSHYFLTQQWGRDHELEADKLGLIFSYMAGYDVTVIPDFWQKFASMGGNEFDFFSTHPSDDKRIAVMRESLYEVYNEKDFYSKPLLPETPKAKNEFKNNNFIPPVQQNHLNNIIESNDSEETGVSQYCTNCGNKIEDGAKFCINCGYKINNEILCPNCGEKIFSGNYCTNCGYKL